MAGFGKGFGIGLLASIAGKAEAILNNWVDHNGDQYVDHNGDSYVLSKTV